MSGDDIREVHDVSESETETKNDEDEMEENSRAKQATAPSEG